jgi:hypothetical protein
MFSSISNLRQKWALRGKYNRMQGLWTEYVKVSGLQGREEEINSRLNAFLKAFQESEIGSEPGALSNIVDNATEVLDALLVYASQSKADSAEAGGNDVSGTFDKALRVIEVILREDQYRTQVHGEWPGCLAVVLMIFGKKRLCLGPDPRVFSLFSSFHLFVDTSHVVDRLLVLLETHDDVEVKKVVVRMLARMANTPENKVEIGRQRVGLI